MARQKFIDYIYKEKHNLQYGVGNALTSKPVWYIQNCYTFMASNHVITRMKVPDNPRKEFKEMMDIWPGLVICQMDVGA